MDGGGHSLTAENGWLPSVTPVPWPTDSLWTQAQTALRRSLAANGTRMAPARRQAAAIAHDRGCLAALFEEVAAITCAVCATPCCLHAKVWFDFKDLLFLHLNRKPLPPHQLRRNLRGSCRYLESRGCHLPHQARPWICSWYICPDLQGAITRDVPGGWVLVDGLRERVKARRDAMEKAYLEALGFSAAQAALSDRVIG